MIATWENNGTKVSIYDTITKMWESFNVNTIIPKDSEGIMVSN